MLGPSAEVPRNDPYGNNSWHMQLMTAQLTPGVNTVRVTHGLVDERIIHTYTVYDEQQYLYLCNIGIC